jgi:hypothetical protein
MGKEKRKERKRERGTDRGRERERKITLSAARTINREQTVVEQPMHAAGVCLVGTGHRAVSNQTSSSSVVGTCLSLSAFATAAVYRSRYVFFSLIFIYLFAYLMTASQIPIVICISVTKQRWFVKFGRWNKHHFFRYHEPSTSDHISSPLKDKSCRIISAKFTIV